MAHKPATSTWATGSAFVSPLAGGRNHDLHGFEKRRLGWLGSGWRWDRFKEWSTPGGRVIGFFRFEVAWWCQVVYRLFKTKAFFGKDYFPVDSYWLERISTTKQVFFQGGCKHDLLSSDCRILPRRVRKTDVLATCPGLYLWFWALYLQFWG